MGTPAIPSYQDDTRGAILAILAACLFLSLGDAIVKAVSVSLPLWQLFLLRSAIALPAFVWFLRWRHPALSLVPRAPGWAILRSLLLVMMWAAYYASLPLIPLSVAAAAYYTLPLFITLFAAVFVGDKVGPTGWGSIGLGFVGVVVMLRPNAAGFEVAALLPILAAVFYALAMILTRTKCRGEMPLILSFVQQMTFVIVGLAMGGGLWLADLSPGAVAGNVFLLGGWTDLDATGSLALVAMAAAVVIGSCFSAYAYQVGAPSTVSSFDYSYLVFSVVWGVVFFTEIPDGLTVLGIVIIAAAGLIAVRR